MPTAPDDSRATTDLLQGMRSLFRFNLRTALLFVAIVCCFLAWISRDVHLAYRRSRLATEVARLGGSCQRVPVKVSHYSAIHWIANGWGRELAEPIRSVSIAGSSATDRQVSGIIPLIRALPEVQRISLVRSGVTDSNVELLATCIELRHIDLSENAITNSGLGALAQLLNLEELSLAGTAVEDEGVLRLRSLSKLQILDLSLTNVTDRSLDAAHGWPKLQHLSLKQTAVTDVGVLALQRRLPMLQIQVHADLYLRSYYEMSQNRGILLRDSFFTDAYLECFENVHFPYVVDLSGSRITASGLNSVPKEKWNWIRRLSLGGELIDNQSLEVISDWYGIEELSLRDTIVTNAGLEFLAKLPRLRRLWLTGSPLTDEDLLPIGELGELEFLDLSMTRIEGAGLRHLAGLTKLRRLALVQTTITDDSLGNLPPLPALECLDVDRTSISDRSVEHLKAFPRLWEVNSHRTAFSAATREFFAARRPPDQGERPFNLDDSADTSSP